MVTMGSWRKSKRNILTNSLHLGLYEILLTILLFFGFLPLYEKFNQWEEPYRA
uniref:Brix domain containing protein n=1 Tax=Rhizophora mucronata TaxID=61149 RepID=A0A2P2JD43_RHIMU